MNGEIVADWKPDSPPRTTGPPDGPTVEGAACELPGTDLWVREEWGGIFRVGLTPAGQERVGPVVYVRGPSAAHRFREGEPAISLESSKWVGHLALPSAGELLEMNPLAIADPALINRDPLGSGWLYRMRPDDPAEIRARVNPASTPTPPARTGIPVDPARERGR